ncbi:MAG: type II toxin-antitoxin system RelE/ParE family toxin [Candidatus Micrarchaeota archaeon]
MNRELVWTEKFKTDVKHFKDSSLLEKLRKQIEKILENPEIGKPLRYNLKGERTIYVKPYRILYAFDDKNIYLLRFEHRGHAYD